jgi:hypothetical protein
MPFHALPDLRDRGEGKNNKTPKAPIAPVFESAKSTNEMPNSVNAAKRHSALYQGKWHHSNTEYENCTSNDSFHEHNILSAEYTELFKRFMRV